MDEEHRKLMKNMYPLEDIKSKGGWEFIKDIIYGMWS
jgi:hypothetical protein